jgi:hypothetical protein
MRKRCAVNYCVGGRQWCVAIIHLQKPTYAVRRLVMRLLDAHQRPGLIKLSRVILAMHMPIMFWTLAKGMFVWPSCGFPEK